MPILQAGNMGLIEVESRDLRCQSNYEGLVGEAPKQLEVSS